MSAPVLGVDVAKQRIEVALFVGGKVKDKSFNNTTEGFETLALWLRKLGIPKVQACLEATGNYGEDLAIYLHGPLVTPKRFLDSISIHHMNLNLSLHVFGRTFPTVFQ